MFHTPSISMVKKQAEAMKTPLITQDTMGEKEKELIDLEYAIKKAMKQYNITGVVTGAVESVYQASRVQKICDKLGVECFNPLWHKKPSKYWNELLKNDFEIIITGVSADGMGEEWLGRVVDKAMLDKLKMIQNKYRIHLGFEGGEAETFVLDCPLFYKKLRIVESKKNFFRNSGVFNIYNVQLVDK